MTFESFTLTEAGGSLVLAMQTSDATAAEVSFHLEIKTPSQSWDDVAPTVMFKATAAGFANQQVFLPLNMRNFSARAKIQDSTTSEFTFSREVTYDDGSVEVDAVRVPNARTVTYKDARDALIERHGITAPTAADYARCAQFLSSAYRQCLEEWKWQEALLSATVTVTDGLVTWTDLQGADSYAFYTVSPLTDSTRETAKRVEVLHTCAAGVYLDMAGLSLTEVWVEFMRRPPVFSATVLESGTSYGLGTVGYVDSTGHCYECIATDGAYGSEFANGAKWRSLPLLWKLLEPTLDLAEAHFFSRSQERGQATSLRNSAEAHFDRLSRLQPLDTNS